MIYWRQLEISTLCSDFHYYAWKILLLCSKGATFMLHHAHIKKQKGQYLPWTLIIWNRSNALVIRHYVGLIIVAMNFLVIAKLVLMQQKRTCAVCTVKSGEWYTVFYWPAQSPQPSASFWHYGIEPRFNEVSRDWENWFVTPRVGFAENNQNIRYIEV